MSNIAVIGEKEIVVGFSLIGFQPFPVANYTEAKEVLERCVTDGNFSIVFITDSIAKLLIIEIEKYQQTSPISICILPDRIQDSKLNIEMLRKNVEKAVGTDILFRKEE